ncbi:MAG: DUF4168 domain-containing protein [Flavobacteriaceae bacterium]|nr:DUF4168 domain-containing protein [Flavobacteriaceae bacterium]
MRLVHKPLHFIIALALVVTTSTFAQEKVSDTELTNFANAYTEIQMVNEKAQSEMVKVIENSGMEIQTFNMMYQASQNPNAQIPVKVSDEDNKLYDEVIVEIEKLQPVFQKEMEMAIADNNLSIERYQQVVSMLQTDQELQQKLQAKMQQ